MKQDVYIVRAGLHARRLGYVLATSRAIVEHGEIGDLAAYRDMDEILGGLVSAFPETNQSRLRLYAGQLFTFRQLDLGALFLIPDFGRRTSWLAEVVGDYVFRTETFGQIHTRGIAWRGKLDWRVVPTKLGNRLGAIQALFRLNEAFVPQCLELVQYGEAPR
jgi:predicted Mrr-cat superfamily restriction endonuclease